MACYLAQINKFKGINMNLLEIGKIVRPHGVKGAVKVVKYLDTNFSHFTKIYVGQKLQPAEIKSVANLNNDACALTIDLIKDCDMAEKFRNQSVYIDRNDYAEFKDKIYLSDLLHKPVLTENGEKLGEVVDFDDYGASTILTIKCGAVSYQIPYVEDIINYNADLDAFLIDEQTFKDVRI